MKTGLRALITAGFFVVLSCSYTEQRGAAASEEIIVKFAADQAINDTVVRAFDDADAEASLEASVRDLSAELGVPFDYSRLTSGREIVIEIPTKRVLEVLAGFLGDSDEVQEFVIALASSEIPNSVDQLLVTIDRSKIEPGPDVTAEALGARLVDDERFPVICDFRADGRLGIAPDFEQLVAALVEELTSRPDIDYAQPNYRVRHFDNK